MEWLLTLAIIVWTIFVARTAFKVGYGLGLVAGAVEAMKSYLEDRRMSEGRGD